MPTANKSAVHIVVGSFVRQRSRFGRPLGKGEVMDIWEDDEGEHLLVFWCRKANQFEAGVVWKKRLERRVNLRLIPPDPEKGKS
jgi:hypothetical protein